MAKQEKYIVRRAILRAIFAIIIRLFTIRIGVALLLPPLCYADREVPYTRSAMTDDREEGSVVPNEVRDTFTGGSIMPDTRLDKRVGQIGAISERIREKDGADTFRTLSDRIKKLNEEKMPLSLQEAEQLLMLYARCGVQLKKKYDATASAKPEEASYYLKLMKKITKDYMAMNRYHNRLKAYQEEGKANCSRRRRRLWDIRSSNDGYTSLRIAE